MKDVIFSDQEKHSSLLRSFSFSSKVAEVFDDMIARSVPGYQTQQDFIATFALQLLRDGDRVLDLGCSTGTTIACISERAQFCKKNLNKVSVYGYDKSSHMVKHCRKKLTTYLPLWEQCEIFQSDLCKDTQRRNIRTQHQGKVRLLLLHYVLQFIPLELRLSLLRELWDLLMEGAGLILGEKLRSDVPSVQALWDKKHEEFKRSNGYSKVEISRKQQSLKGVLIPITEAMLRDLLHQLPGSKVELFYVWGAFHSFIVWKRWETLS